MLIIIQIYYCTIDYTDVTATIIYFYSTGLALQDLCEASIRRLTKALRPDTWRRYQGSYNKFQGFCLTNGIDPTQCPLTDYLAFSEFLVQQGLAATISNHLSAIKTYCKWLGTNEHLWQTDHWRWMHRSLALSVRNTPKLQTAVTFPPLQLSFECL